MKVKLFLSGSIETLEKNINDFISTVEPICVEVKSINTYFSAVISYKTQGD